MSHDQQLRVAGDAFSHMLRIDEASFVETCGYQGVNEFEATAIMTSQYLKHYMIASCGCGVTLEDAIENVKKMYDGVMQDISREADA